MRECGLKVEAELAAYADKLAVEVQEELQGQGVDVFSYTPEALEKIDGKLEESRRDYVGRLEARGLPAEKAYADYLAALGRE